MDKQSIQEVMEFLDTLNIKYLVHENIIKISRDSMVNTFEKDFEEDSYKALILELKKVFKRSYYFCQKTDDDLFLDIIEYGE